MLVCSSRIKQESTADNKQISANNQKNPADVFLWAKAHLPDALEEKIAPITTPACGEGV